MLVIDLYDRVMSYVYDDIIVDLELGLPRYNSQEKVDELV